MKNLHYSKINKFTARLEVEVANRGNFYLCPNACVRANFETATEYEFKCPECGVVLNHQDNDKTIEFLQTKIKELHKTNGFAKRNSLKKFIEDVKKAEEEYKKGNFTRFSNKGEAKKHLDSL